MGFPYSSGDVLTAADLNASFGMVLIGSYTGSSISSLTVDNILTSQFTFYRFVIGTRALDNNLILNFRSGGVTDTSSNYSYAATGRSITGTDYTLNVSGGTYWRVINRNIAVTDALNACAFDVYFPAETEESMFTGNMQSYFSGGNSISWVMGGHLNTSTAYDGVQIKPFSGTMDHTTNIYGYNNG